MVRTRRGAVTSRFEDQRQWFRQYARDNILNAFGSDSESEQESVEYNYEPAQNDEPTDTRFYHIGHPHEHPGFYKDQDEHHRHRFGRPNRNSRNATWMPGHYRRTPLF